jgi:uncharacterized protein (TIGR03118 family)
MQKKLRTSWISVFAGMSLMAAILFLALPAAAAGGYFQTNLVSDGFVSAAHVDPNLINPWGIASSTTSHFWVSNNGTGVATLYDGSGTPNALVVTIPPPAGSPVGTLSTPTGVVFNYTGGFEVSLGKSASFIFATEDGTISGWNPSANPTGALLKVDNSPSGAVYTGLALGTIGANSYLYAANFHQGTIDVFDSGFSQTTLSGFTDPNLPAGYAPFNVQNLGGSLLVTYALQDATGHNPDSGLGLGIVDRFDLNGNLLQRLISPGGPLNAPWGLALAPADFGEFSNDLLVGNFGDGKINAFDPTTGAFLGALTDKNGVPISIDGLWGLTFGNGGNGGDPNTLYFTAGLSGEAHGLFGSLAPVPVPATFILLGSGLARLLTFARVKRKRT